MQLDPKLPEDLGAVLETAAFLEISEFRVFQLAYADWFGREADSPVIEAYFTPYMYRAVVPPWVRHFTRLVQARQRDGTFNSRAYGIHPRELSRADIYRGRLYITYLVASLLVLLMVAELAADWLGLRGCLLPPCY